ncbi:aspartyl-phosphate phosphatase Spo0E family protein [Priestia megaterium]|uniref:aspartyl-phosphate phosphatase Spo0E family protein n=1 Tax=Priestia megaterium TaxID=1404 RepID=UPI001CB9A6CD|nr:aspartyl-phosphate phosphatase Spo0E family protein [Priestia megaterium]MDP1442511.1 aspartyl-phosphate phosphatase Spo0E family protein [Priestia megaterium]MDP1471489.1 aspartyl-phosphate phosphatase Spo0E family protein [Priestia megaterium]MED3928926.1 aspartyl-phosphate phosphatase Spo0E family protein [Priestia megaterium]
MAILLITNAINSSNVSNLLLSEIEKARELMIATVLREGLTSPATLSISQNLDLLLNDLNSILIK